MSALEIQEAYLERVDRFIQSQYPGDEYAKDVLARWRYVIETLRVDPTRLSRELDWVAKYQLIEAYRTRHDLPLAHPRIAMLDLAYHNVARDRGLYYLLERQGRIDRLLTDEEIEDAKEEPPATTRAALRGRFIRHAKARRRDYTVDWVHLKLNDQAQRTVLCKDPFKYDDERVDKLIASM
jgi:proteasome accessory factor A